MIRGWEKWEDWQSGLYSSGSDSERQAESADLLRDADRFREVAREMVREWPNAAQHNLGNMKSGHNAWVGQASCCYAHGATSTETRTAWGLLTNSEQMDANRAARTVIREWEREVQDAQTILGL